MSNMQFGFGSTQFDITAEQFCDAFALVIDQNQEPDKQVSVKLLKEYNGYSKDDEYYLDEGEQASVFSCLGIKVKIPKKKGGGNSGVITIAGNVSETNLTTGNGNKVDHTCINGLNLTTIVSGNGIEVTNA